MPDFKVYLNFHGMNDCSLTMTELDIETGKVLFEWSSLKYVDPSGL